MITQSHFLQKHAQNPLVKGDSLKAITLLVISLLQERVEMLPNSFLFGEKC